jgi:serine/threonine protein kinase
LKSLSLQLLHDDFLDSEPAIPIICINEARLADFGIAIVQARHLSDPGTVIRGTPEYMAPEQFMGKNERKSDQYSLACVAYQLLTGHLPFIAPNNIALGFKHLQEPPIPLHGLNPLIPAHIEYAVLKAMSKNCADRYESVAGFVRALQ